MRSVRPCHSGRRSSLQTDNGSDERTAGSVICIERLRVCAGAGNRWSSDLGQRSLNERRCPAALSSAMQTMTSLEPKGVRVVGRLTSACTISRRDVITSRCGSRIGVRLEFRRPADPPLWRVLLPFFAANLTFHNGSNSDSKRRPFSQVAKMPECIRREQGIGLTPAESTAMRSRA